MLEHVSMGRVPHQFQFDLIRNASLHKRSNPGLLNPTPCKPTNLYMVVSQNKGTPIWTPLYYNPYYGDPQEGIHNPKPCTPKAFGSCTLNFLYSFLLGSTLQSLLNHHDTPPKTTQAIFGIHSHP